MSKNALLYKQLYTLLAAGIGACEKADSSLFGKQTDWVALHKLSIQQAVPALVWDGMLTLPESLRPSRDIFLKWYAVVLRTEKSNQQLNAVLGEVRDVLCESLHLPYALLKGQGTAAVYPDPLHRTCGDIDIYVGCKGRAVVDKSMEEYGFVRGGISSKQTEYVYKKVNIEVHSIVSLLFWLPAAYRLSKIVKSWFAAKNKVDYFDLPCEGDKALSVPVPPKWFAAAHAVVHFNHHLCDEGVGLRHVCDWYLLRKSIPDVDMVSYRSMISALGVGYLERALSQLVDMMFNGDETALTPAATLIEQRIWQGGNFGKYAAVKKGHAFASQGGYFVVMFRLLAHRVANSIRFFRFNPFELTLVPLFTVAGYIRRGGGKRK